MSGIVPTDLPPVAVLGGKPWKRAEWAGTGSARPKPSQQARPAGRTTSSRKDGTR
ncbi:hypothetical protein [Micromonospora sp. NPDC001898]|uniref:hypothetical protein n=1 Tax=Micromonospora sp. NPDC001898 TaxID=3364221 RepID=UPI0036982DA1